MIVFALLVMLHLFASTSFGITFRRGEDIVIGEGKVIEGDLFLAGNTLETTIFRQNRE
jgi:hypothetical protein